MLRKILCVGACLSALLAGSLFAQDKSTFKTVARVNDSVVTQFELDQRILMLEALGTGGNVSKAAMKNLIDERLYEQAAKEMDIRVTQDEIDKGMEEFASRGNLSKDEMLSYLKDKGVEEVSFRRFVRDGLLWRTVVQSKFLRKATIQDDELDSALNIGATQTQLSLLISELVLPFQERGEVETRRLAAELSHSIHGSADFAAAAARYSSAPSAKNNGRLEWTPASKIAPQILTQLLALDPGQVTPPIEFPKFVGLFMLRDVRSERISNPLPVTLSYVLVNLPPMQNAAVEAQNLIGKVDTCMDLRAVAQKYGEDATKEATVQSTAAPTPLAGELAKLDRNEAIAFSNSNGQTSVVMLCNRIRELPQESRNGLRQALFNERISGFGDSYLQELRGQAVIEVK